jgi:phosphoglycolate phosphatase
VLTTALLDLDGTLTDPLEGIGNALDRAMAALGMPGLRPEQRRAAVGPPLAEVFATLGVPDDRVDDAIAAYREYYGHQGLLENRVYDGVPDALARVRDAGIRLVLATSKPEPFAARIVERFGLAPLLDHVAGATLDGTVARKADVIARALAAVGAAAGPDVVMVGDRSHDVLGAAEHGLTCVGVEWGYAEPGELEAAGAIAVVRTPGELADLLAAMVE